MKVNFKLVTGILAAALVYDYSVARKNRKINEALRAELLSSFDRNLFLCEKLDAAEVPFDEFDKIIFHAL